MKTDQDVSFVAGDRIDLRYTVTDDVTGLVKNLSGVTAVQWKMSKKITRSDGTETFSSTPVVSKSLGSGITVAAETGLITVALMNADTKDLSQGSYHSELEITSIDSSGPFTVAIGTVILLKELIK